MADIHIIDERTLKITVGLEDALTMIAEAERDVGTFAHDILTMTEKMPEFGYVHFCFYAYDSAELFEHMLGMDPKAYLSFSLDAPDSFFYTLYGGMSALAEQARMLQEGEAVLS